MATTTWFAAGDSCLRGYVREEHVVVRLWSDERGSILRRATCLPSSAQAESWLQRLLAEEARSASDGLPRRAAWRGQVAEVLAQEVASAVDRPQGWRDWADWLWRHGDARGARIELGEALAAAIGTAREPRLRAEIAQLDRVQGWRAQLDELERASGALVRPGDPGPQLRLEHGQLVGFRGPVAFGRQSGVGLAALAELHTRVHDPLSLARLHEALASNQLGGLTTLHLELDSALDRDASGELIDGIARGLARLRKLVIRSSSGLAIGEPLMLALGRLLTRQREPVRGLALVELELDLGLELAPEHAGAWTPALVDDLCGVLARSGLERVRLSAPSWPRALQAWIRMSGWDRRLLECRLIERCPVPTTQARARVLGPAPTLALPLEPESTCVWADWLLSHGDPLGELALLLGREQDLATRERVAVLRAEQRAMLSDGRPEALVLDWCGPLLERVEVLGDRCPDPVTMLERVLASPAATRLGSLHLRGFTPAWTLLESPSLRGLERLSLDVPTPIARVLESLPELRELGVGVPDLDALPSTRHARLSELALVLPSEWGKRVCSGFFARFGPALLPGLRRLTLDLVPGRRGPALPIAQLELASDATLRVIGSLRDCDHPSLHRWSRQNPDAWLESDAAMWRGHSSSRRFRGGRPR